MANQTNNKYSGIFIDKNILSLTDLNMNEKVVLSEVVNVKKHFKSRQKMAKQMGLTGPAISSIFTRLLDKGYIVCVGQRLRRREYSISNKTRTLIGKMTQEQFDNVGEIESYIPNDKCFKPKEPKNEKKMLIKTNLGVSPEAIDLAQHLKNKILEHQPNAHIDKNYITNWGRDFDKAHRIDGRRWQSMKEMINYCYDISDFWCMNIRSGVKLRKHYDRIELEIRKFALKHGTMVAGDRNPNDNLPF